MLELKFAHMGGNPRIEPLLSGEVKVPDVQIVDDTENHGDLFAWLLDHGDERDVFEFSISHYMTTFEKHEARRDWTAIPMFLQKATPFLDTRVNVNSDINSLADLRGKKVGMGDYAMTAAVWLRVALNDLAHVPPQDVHWFAGREAHRSHDWQLGIQEMIKPGLNVTWLNDDTALDRMVASGEIDAAFGIKEDPQNRRLFPNGGADLFADFYKSYGYLPVNHCILIRRALAEQNPWLPKALYDGFEASKQAAYQRDPAARLPLPKEDGPSQMALYGEDPYPSGLKANRPMLEALARQSHTEGLTQGLVNVEEMFHESVRNT